MVCIALTIGLIKLLKKGLTMFFENLCQDDEVAKFFTKLTTIILLLAGLSAAHHSYKLGDKLNWLTLSWSSARHITGTLEILLIIMTIFAISFFILHLVGRKLNK